MPKEYRIYLEEINNGKSKIAGGYYTWGDIDPRYNNGYNSPSMDYVYCRTSDPDKFCVIRYYTKEDCARVMNHMRQKGYPCHAEPSFTITNKY